MVWEIPFHQLSVTVLTKYKRPRRSKPGPVTKGGNAAPHHVWDSTTKAFRSFKANLREIHVIGLAVVASFWPFIIDKL
jgi:hypothetical protein